MTRSYLTDAVSIRADLAKADYDRLRELSEKSQLPMAAIIRQAIRHYLREPADDRQLYQS